MNPQPQPEFRQGAETAPPVPPPLPDVSSPETSGPKNLNEFERLAGVFFSPARAFADIVRRPRWWIPIILIGLMSSVYINAYGRRVGFERFARQQIEQSSRYDSMTGQQREQAVIVTETILKAVSYGAVFTTALTMLITAAVMLFMVNSLLGGEVKLGSMMGVVSYGFLPLILVSALSMLVMFLKNPEDFNLQNPLAFNAGAFLAADSAQWLKGLAGSFDLFSFWIMALIAIGISAACPRIKFGKAFGAVLFPWALLVALRASVQFAFS